MAAILEIRNLSKQYKLAGRMRQTENFREFLLRGLKAPFTRLTQQDAEAKRRLFWAVRDVSFDVAEGEVLGVIGRNGAGKSTLLKLISRITAPTEGQITVRGRLASLLEVGTGFHPELTGRENIFLNGAILGMRRAEITAHFDEIVAFSEVEQFLDTPVKHYSSGMYVRLAFAVAAHLNPEILIVDEVLAVGDVAFQKKCMGKMSEVSQGGRTVLFVSHNMAAVENLCNRAMVLDAGSMVFNGGSKDAIRFYLDSISGSGEGAESHSVDLGNARGRSPRRRALFSRIEFLTENDQPVVTGLPMGAPLKMRVHFTLDRKTSSFNVGVGFDDTYGLRIFTAHSEYEPERMHGECAGPQVFVCEIPSFALTPGEYKLRMWLDVNGILSDLIDDAARLTVIDSDFYGTGKVARMGKVVLKQRWQMEQAATVPAQ